ncbi:MAG: hypothetical protein RLZZ35_853 [Actinomycetota bacterium]
MPRDKSIESVLVIGSGPIVIGQACEFELVAFSNQRAYE